MAYDVQLTAEDVHAYHERENLQKQVQYVGQKVWDLKDVYEKNDGWGDVVSPYKRETPKLKRNAICEVCLEKNKRCKCEKDDK